MPVPRTLTSSPILFIHLSYFCVSVICVCVCVRVCVCVCWFVVRAFASERAAVLCVCVTQRDTPALDPSHRTNEQIISLSLSLSLSSLYMCVLIWADYGATVWI
jgi:hypothetical protein